jgi:hypothetical protein
VWRTARILLRTCQSLCTKERWEMMKWRSYDEYEADAQAGTRHLFRLGQYEFHDTMDAEDGFHHYILDGPENGSETSAYEVDRETMYEFMARFLAGVYEMEEYDLEQSPSHNALLDVLEIATARARGGETEFDWEDFDRPDTELMEGEDESAS